jgi:hypothetical protein
MTAKHYLVVDLEATCCNQKTLPAREKEIIEIGAIMCDADFKLLSSFQSFIRPVRHPQLTPFCSEPTSIQQSDVEHAPLLPKRSLALKPGSINSLTLYFVRRAATTANSLNKIAPSAASSPIRLKRSLLEISFNRDIDTQRKSGKVMCEIWHQLSDQCGAYQPERALRPTARFSKKAGC